MPDIEKRLKALEKRARIDTERWHALSGEIKAICAIISAIGAPICAGKPIRTKAIIQNLKLYERIAREQNEHAQMIVRLRHEREFFESRIKRGEIGGSTSGKTSSPHSKK
jgi:hypothetical protein